MLKTKPVIFLLPMLIFSLQLQISFTSGRSVVDKSLAPVPLSTPSNSLNMSATGVAAQWSHENRVTSAREENINPSQTVVIPAENGYGDQQQEFPNASSNDNTNASVSFKILKIGGPIGLLTLVVIFIYWLFFKKRNNWSCFISRENPTADESNYNCGIEFKCLS